MDRIVGREQQQNLRLQRIGVLKFVDEQPLEPLLKAAAHIGIVFHQVPRLQQQVEKIERAGFGFLLFIPLCTRAQLAAQQRREIGIRIGLEARELCLQLVARTRDVFARTPDL